MNAVQLVTPELKKELIKFQESIISKELRCNIFLPFGLNLLNYEILYTGDTPGGFPAAVYKDKIFINPFSDVFGICTGSVTKRNALTLLFNHEILHPMLYHDKRVGKRDRILWNIAGDFVINLLLSQLERESKDQCPSTPLVDMQFSSFTKHMMVDERFNGMIEEEVYDYLKNNGHFKKKVTKIPLSKFLKQVGMPCDEKGEDNDQKKKDKKQEQGEGQEDQEEAEITVTETDFKLGKKEFHHTDIEFPRFSGEPSKKEKEDENSREDRRQISRQMLENVLSRGIKSAELKRFLGRLFGVKIDWAKITKDSLMTAFEKSTEMTWGRPRATWLANPGLPYLPNIDEKERFGIAVFAVDESGSMSDKDVIRAVDIMLQAKEFYKGLLVIKHDSEVKWFKYYENIEDLDANELATRRHYGGTSHKEVFETVNEFLREHPEDMISVFLACTDLCSDIEETQNILDNGIPRIYLVNNGGRISDKIVGRIIRVDE